MGSIVLIKWTQQCLKKKRVKPGVFPHSPLKQFKLEIYFTREIKRMNPVYSSLINIQTAYRWDWFSGTSCPREDPYKSTKLKNSLCSFGTQEEHHHLRAIGERSVFIRDFRPSSWAKDALKQHLFSRKTDSRGRLVYNFGVSPFYRVLLISEIEVIINCEASVNSYDHLHDAIRINSQGTSKILDLGHQF